MALLTVNSLEFVRLTFESFGIIADDDDISDSQYRKGLFYLNEILAADAADGVSIPTFHQMKFNLIAGQAWYEISHNLLAEVQDNPIMDLEDGTLLYSNLVQYPIVNVRRSELLGVPLALNTQSWPAQMLLYKFKKIVGDRQAVIADMEEDANSCVLRFYPIPNMTYPVVIYAKNVLNNVEKNADITFPAHMLMYMRYSLGEALTRKYDNSMWKPEDIAKLEKLRNAFTAGNEIDTSFDPSPTLQSGAPSKPQSTNVPYY